VANDPINPTDLVGERVDSVIIGWHCFESTRSAARLFLRFFNEIHVEAHTAGSGALALLRGPVPDDFSMNEYGRYEFRDAEVEEPAARLVGQTIRTVEEIRWRETVVGYRLGTERGPVVLVNEADEVFTSNGTLPPDYADATIG
jgi:hypothetical protein